MIRLFGQLLAPDGLGRCLVTVEGGRITAIERIETPPADALGGARSILVPGLIDIQLNGGSARTSPIPRPTSPSSAGSFRATG